MTQTQILPQALDRLSRKQLREIARQRQQRLNQWREDKRAEKLTDAKPRKLPKGLRQARIQAAEQQAERAQRNFGLERHYFTWAGIEAGAMSNVTCDACGYAYEHPLHLQRAPETVVDVDTDLLDEFKDLDPADRDDAVEDYIETVTEYRLKYGEWQHVPDDLGRGERKQDMVVDQLQQRPLRPEKEQGLRKDTLGRCRHGDPRMQLTCRRCRLFDDTTLSSRQLLCLLPVKRRAQVIDLDSRSIGRMHRVVGVKRYEDTSWRFHF